MANQNLALVDSSREFLEETHLPSRMMMWLMRILFPLNAMDDFIRNYGYINDAAARVAGLNYFGRDGDFEKDDAIYAAKQHWEKIRHLPVDLDEPDILQKNIELLSHAVGLSAIESKVLELCYRMQIDNSLACMINLLEASYVKVPELISVILAEPLQPVIDALSPHGKLASSRLVALDPTGYSVPGMIHPYSSSDVVVMLNRHDSIAELMRSSVRVAEQAELTLHDYGYIAEKIDVISSHLRHALHNHARGINILIYGPPGTGKTQLTRVLANVLSAKCLEVSCCYHDGTSMRPKDRLRALTLAHEVFREGSCVLVFDEMEDITGTEFSMLLGDAAISGAKAWMNNLLESNRIPTLWLSNQITHMDSAILRRFDIILEVKAMTAGQRLKFLNEHCGDLLSEQWRKHLAGIDMLSPAIIQRACAVVRQQLDNCSNDEISRKLIGLIESALAAQGVVLPPLPVGAMNYGYRPELINAPIDLRQVAEGVRNAGGGRILLYGPPGTGKTAYCRWLAEQLDRPLLLKQASDILSSLVGGTEKNLAAVFSDASKTGAVLVIDEVDSFLTDRREARHSWEVTAVNEFLVQLERYEGVVLASTNRLDNLDAAALRRFEMKLEFGYLRAEQIQQLVDECCFELGLIEKNPLQIESGVTNLQMLTPGDFAAVRRRSRLSPLRTCDELLAALTQECSLKEGFSKRSIGFL